MQKTRWRCKSGRRMSGLQLGMTVTYSTAQQDHPCSSIHLAEHRCSKAELVFYKISTWDHSCVTQSLCHTFQCWINLFSWISVPGDREGWTVTLHLLLELCFTRCWWRSMGAERCWSGALQSVSGQRFSLKLNREETIWALSLWPVINILCVSLECNQGQEICFLPKLKKCVETWCAESTNASWHLFVQQTESSWSRDAPGNPYWLSSFVLQCELWVWTRAKHTSWPLALCWEKTARGNFGRAGSGRDVEQSSSCFATALAASTTSQPPLSPMAGCSRTGWGIFPAGKGLGWAELLQFRWGQAGLGCTAPTPSVSFG